MISKERSEKINLKSEAPITREEFSDFVEKTKSTVIDRTGLSKIQIEETKNWANALSETEVRILLKELFKNRPDIVFDVLSKEFGKMKDKLGIIFGVFKEED